MSDILNCPKCQGMLKLPPGTTAKKIKCPTCGTIFSPPAGPVAAPARPAGSSSTLRPPPARPKSAKPDFEIVDEEPDALPVARVVRPGAPRYDDDIPVSREDADYGEMDERTRSRMRKAQLGRARLGILLNFIGIWCMVGALGVMVLFSLLSWTGTTVNPDYMVLAGLPGLANWLLAVVGLSFCIAGPAKFGARGLAIAGVAVAAVNLVLMLVAAQDRPAVHAFGVRTSSFDWMHVISNMTYLTQFLVILTTKGVELDLLNLFAGIAELAQLILFMLFLNAIAKNARNSSTAGATTGPIIALPSTLVGLMVIQLLISIIFKNSSGASIKTYINIMHVLILLTFGGLLGVMVWYNLTVNRVKDAVDYARSR
jgi:LSD1 subclass zinc finger protein